MYTMVYFLLCIEAGLFNKKIEWKGGWVEMSELVGSAIDDRFTRWLALLQFPRLPILKLGHHPEIC